MTEPTDDELDALCVEISDYDDPAYFRVMARAVLAKWGTPAVAGEPVAWQYQSGDGLWHNFIDARHYKNTVDSGEWPIRALYTATQPTQAQAGAVPLTTETDCGGESCDCRSYCKKKGGQHGADT